MGTSFSEASDWSTVSMLAADWSAQWTLILMSATGSWSLPPLSAQLKARVAVEQYFARVAVEQYYARVSVELYFLLS